MENKQIIVNAIKCLHCGDIIESKHRHDFKWCDCGKVAVDGGKDYLSRTFQVPADYLEMSIEIDEEEIIIPKKRTLKFRTDDFYQMGESENSYKVTDKETQEFIDECIDNILINNRNDCALATGDTLVAATKYEDDGIIEVIVSKNYYTGTLIIDE